MTAARSTPGSVPMRIGEAGRRLGINPRTIRYYESLGLVSSAGRSAANYRQFSGDDFERLRFISTARRLGLGLSDIREILDYRDRGERPCGYVLGAVRREVAELDRRIDELHALRQELHQLIERANETDRAIDAGYCELIEHRSKQQRKPRESARRPRLDLPATGRTRL